MAISVGNVTGDAPGGRWRGPSREGAPENKCRRKDCDEDERAQASAGSADWSDGHGSPKGAEARPRRASRDVLPESEPLWVCVKQQKCERVTLSTPEAEPPRKDW